GSDKQQGHGLAGGAKVTQQQHDGNQPSQRQVITLQVFGHTSHRIQAYIQATVAAGDFREMQQYFRQGQGERHGGHRQVDPGQMARRKGKNGTQQSTDQRCNRQAEQHGQRQILFDQGDRVSACGCKNAMTDGHFTTIADQEADGQNGNGISKTQAQREGPVATRHHGQHQQNQQNNQRQG